MSSQLLETYHKIEYIMPMTIVRRPRSPNVMHEVVRNEVREAFRTFCKEAIKRLEKDIKGWEHQPVFRYKVAAGTKLWYVNISYDSESEAGQIYKWVDEGTGENAGKGPKYPIVPKNAKALQFIYPTRVKTTPGVAGIPGIVMAGGSGKKELITTKKVMHPGIKPRHFVKSLRDELNNRNKPGGFKSTVDAAVKRGLRKIGSSR